VRPAAGSERQRTPRVDASSAPREPDAQGSIVAKVKLP
jgi:hypothetical protein